VIVDDPWGRELAARDALDFHETVWVLQRFYELGLIKPSALRAGFTSLRDREYRLPWEAVNALLVQIGEKPLNP
jgi:predicted nucleic acid-binding protein